jgi:hypothetical protein
MGTSVFLSHAAADIELVRKVEKHARTLDVQTYLYEDDPQAGGAIATKLLEAIQRSDAVIVLLTKNSQHRSSVHSEVGAARTLGKLIIPIIEVGVDPLQFVFLQGLEWIELDFDKLDEALLGVQQRLKQMVDLAKEHATMLVVLLILGAIIYFAAKRA